MTYLFPCSESWLLIPPRYNGFSFPFQLLGGKHFLPILLSSLASTQEPAHLFSEGSARDFDD